MIWQDVLIMMGGFGFSIALAPAIISKSKPPRTTCLVTGAILASYCVAFATLGFWLSFIATTLTSVMWFILLFQHRNQL